MFGRKPVVPRPHIFIDVDGTISPNQYPDDEYFYSDWNGGHYFSSQLREELMQLPAEKVWLTGWGVDAEDTFQCGWQTLSGDRSRGNLWKYHAIQDFLKRNAVSKLVWMDDEISKWQDKMPQFSVSSMKICPLINKGLSEHHLFLVKKFLIE